MKYKVKLIFVSGYNRAYEITAAGNEEAILIADGMRFDNMAYRAKLYDANGSRIWSYNVPQWDIK